MHQFSHLLITLVALRILFEESQEIAKIHLFDTVLERINRGRVRVVHDGGLERPNRPPSQLFV